MNKIIVSVVIPTLNRPKHLQKALNSLSAQTILPHEVIIVDQSDDSETEKLIIKKHNTIMTNLKEKQILQKMIKKKENEIKKLCSYITNNNTEREKKVIERSNEKKNELTNLRTSLKKVNKPLKTKEIDLSSFKELINKYVLEVESLKDKIKKLQEEKSDLTKLNTKLTLDLQNKEKEFDLLKKKDESVSLMLNKKVE